MTWQQALFLFAFYGIAHLMFRGWRLGWRWGLIEMFIMMTLVALAVVAFTTQNNPKH